MTISRLTCSLVVLALFAVPALAQQDASGPAVRLAALTSSDLQSFLADTRSPAALTDAELQQRLKLARQLMEDGNLSKDQVRQVRDILQALKTERQGRESGKNQSQAASQDAGVSPNQAGGQPQVAATTAAVPADVAALIADNRPASALSDDELKKRFNAARGAMQLPGLSPEVRQELQKIAREARSELGNRSNSKGKSQQTGQTAGSDTTQPATGTQKDIAPTAAKVPDDVLAFIRDNRQTKAMTVPELQQRFRRARELIGAGNLPAEVVMQLKTIAREARLELAVRDQAGTQNQSAGQQQGAGQAGGGDTAQPGTGAQKEVLPVATKVPDDVLAFIRDNKQTKAMTIPELQQRFSRARELIGAGNLPAEVVMQLRTIAREVRLELAARDQAGTQDQSAGQQGTGQQAGGGTQTGTGGQQPNTGTGDPQAEAKAKAFLASGATVNQMSDVELRTRLRSIRDLLAINQLSPATELTLRRMLRSERDLLRGRVAKAEDMQVGGGSGGGGSGGGGKPAKGGGTDVTISAYINAPVTVVLADRRPSPQLSDIELRRRIDIYRDAVLDAKYAEQDRLMWRGILDSDRRYLRGRLVDARNRRAGDLVLEKNRGQINIDIGLTFNPSRRPPPDVFAAEVDDRQLEDVLIAPPRRAIARRYSLQEVESNPDLRDVMPRIEIDTIHFGFGESFVREEEVDNLDRIAGIMEKVLAVRPREVFIIEGHTDAVGSDESNLRLSRLRAEAVKQALTTYYVIPPDNLATVGYGERYLKIPTREPEAENRRVSVVRATPLVGELGQ